MKSYELRITKETAERTAEILAWAERNVVPHETMKERFEKFKDRTLKYSPPDEGKQYIEIGFVVVYCIEEHQPGQHWKHLSVSCRDPIPPKLAVDTIMKLYGYTFMVEDCKVWPEPIGQKHVAVNVMQPHGNWYMEKLN